MSKKVHSKVKKIFGSRILVKQYKTPVTIGSLILPVQKTTQQAKVKIVGDEIGPELKPGDDILYDPYHGIKVEGMLLLNKEDVLAVIN